MPGIEAVYVDQNRQCTHYLLMTNHTPPCIIALASGKGGVGKSTNCLNIGAALAYRGYPTTIVDFDQNQTIWSWYASSPQAQKLPKLHVEAAPKTGLDEYVNNLYHTREGIILIDLAGSMNDIMMLIAAFAELVIIPTKLGMVDVMEAQKLAEKIHEVAASLGDKPVAHRILVNETPFEFMLSKAQKHMQAQILSLGIPMFTTETHSRPTYTDWQVTGLPLHFESQSRETVRKAVAEIDQLVDEVLATVGITQHEEKAAA